MGRKSARQVCLDERRVSNGQRAPTHRGTKLCVLRKRQLRGKLRYDSDCCNGNVGSTPSESGSVSRVHIGAPGATEQRPIFPEHSRQRRGPLDKLDSVGSRSSACDFGSDARVRPAADLSGQNIGRDTWCRFSCGVRIRGRHFPPCPGLAGFFESATGRRPGTRVQPRRYQRSIGSTFAIARGTASRIVSSEGGAAHLLSGILVTVLQPRVARCSETFDRVRASGCSARSH